MLPRYLKLTIASLLAAWIAALGVVGWLVLAGRAGALDRSRLATAAFAAVVEQQVGRTLQATYLTLAAVRDAYQLTPRPEPNDAEFRQMMIRRLHDVPFVRALFIIGKNGWITHDTDYPRTPHVPLDDRPYFHAYRQDPSKPETVWPPLLSRSGTGWFLPVTRPLGSPGDFQGVVVAALQASIFEEQFRAIDLPPGYVVGLFHTDGTLVASFPTAGKVGSNYGQELATFRLLPQRSADTFWTRDGLVPGLRLVSYRALAVGPFVVRVSRSEDDILAEWRRTATGAGLAMAALTVLLAWFIVRLARESARRALEGDRRAQTEKLEALGQLSGGIAHDFANLLNVVSMNVALMRAKPGDAALAREALATIDRAVRTGGEVAARLLRFARRQPLSLQRVRLDTWLEAARPLLAQALGSRATLAIEAEHPLPEIVCDPSELDVTLVNLVINARDAMGGSGEVRIRAFVLGNSSAVPDALAGTPARLVCISVRDNGPGMPEDVREHAFEPFYSTKGEGGTGLGLPQVYGFMQQIGGHVTIESRPGQGTTVHLLFPVAAADSGAQS